MIEHPKQTESPEVLLNQQPKKPPIDEAAIVAQAKKDEDSEATMRAEENKKIEAIREKLGLATAPEIKRKFLASFTDGDKKEFAQSFREAAANPEATKLFEKNITGSITFVAYKTEKRFGGGIMFRIMEREEIKAQITFNPEDRNVLNMVHREVQSQALGISGSSLLQKIEEYFKILQESNALSPATTLSVEAGQVTVADWAKKNGYDFRDDAEEQLFTLIVRGQKNDEYVVTDVGDGKLFGNYIFRKDVYDQHKQDINGDPTLAKKYSVRFTLIKKLRANEAKEAVPQPGESTGKAPLVEGLNMVDSDGKKEELNCTLSSSDSLSIEEILTSGKIEQSSIPYYRDVHEDVLKDYEDWGVTKKVKEYADYLVRNPETVATLPPIQVLNNKLHDGAHRISAIYLLSKLYPNSQWTTVKLKVDFYESEVKK